ncbi:MAG: AMP-binding protein [Steroidobacteraceae bacterium]
MTTNQSAHIEGAPLTRQDELQWIGDVPTLGAQRYPDRVAIIHPDRGTQMTYGQLDSQADAFVALLRAHSIEKGARVVYLGRNSDVFVPVFYGAIRHGVVLTPLNWRLTAPEIEFQLEDSRAALVICDADFRATLMQAMAQLDPKPVVVQTEGSPDGNDLRTLLEQNAPRTAVPHDRDQTFLQLYTSGTTGRPKGVLVSHLAFSMARHAEQQCSDFDHYGQGARSLSAMPNFHIGGLSWVMMGLLRFGTVVLTADATPGNLLRLMQAHDVEHSFIVPTVLRDIVENLKNTGAEAPPIKGIFYGGMPMSESLLRECLSLFPAAKFVQFFGMTEITGSCTRLPPQDHDLSRPGLLKSVGKPYPGAALEIRGPDRKVLQLRQHGEIWIKSPSMMQGYWQQPAKTTEAVVDGWYASGDGGYLDEQGYLYLTDRIKDMIVSGGENVYPVEVEEALRQHPAVLDAAVVGAPHERWGEVVIGVLELRPGKHVSEDELRAFARERIAGYKCPKMLRFIAALPRTPSGKVKRAELRAMAKEWVTVK